MKVVIVVEGGCVTQVLADGHHVEVAIVDYDTEGADNSNPFLKTIKWHDGETTEAFVRLEDADFDPDTTDIIWETGNNHV